MGHGEDHDEKAQDGADDELLLQPGRFFLPFFPFPVSQGGPIRAAELISGPFNGLFKGIQIDFSGVINDLGLFRGKIDRRLFHPFEFFQGVFHSNDTSGAAHAPHG
jgi:hypothetical protein